MAEEKTTQPSATEEKSPAPSFSDEALSPELGVNVSGHKQELQRNFDLLSLCGMGLTSGNVWMALGGTIVRSRYNIYLWRPAAYLGPLPQTVAIYNGGPPGIIYEYIAASVFYWMIGASIAELASAVPSSGGGKKTLGPHFHTLGQAEEETVYHWATITAGRYGRACGWFAGWWNCLAWLLALAAQLQIVAAQSVSMYAVMHDGFETARWQVFVTYIILAWIACFTVLYMNRTLPSIQMLGGFLVIAGVFVTIVLCAVLPHVTHKGYATNHSVWEDWQNETGYESNGFVFLLGMLNGAYAVGTPDLLAHLAEEVPHPSSNLPKAILAQFTFGFLSGFCYLIAILYGITDLPAVLTSTYLFPLTEIYRQAAATKPGTIGLLLLALLPNLVSCVGSYITASRCFWTLARDNATPFARFFAHVDGSTHNPFRAIVFSAVFATVLGCVYLGSTTAFAAFVGSFIILSTLSYLAAILPHLLSRRRNVTPGWFWMRGATGFIVNAVSCVYIVVFIVIFCFPFSVPVDAESMNYASLIAGGLSVFVLAFWGVRRGGYVGPRKVVLDAHVLAKDAI